MTLKIFFLLLFTFCISLFLGCASKLPNFQNKLLEEADSLFRTGNFDSSKIKYEKIKEIAQNSPATRTAQYFLGFINIYYDNPSANWEIALQEFKTFASLYPDDFRIQEVNSWIRILVVMQSFKKDYQNVTLQLNEANKKLLDDSNLLNKQNKIQIDSIAESLKQCLAIRDSLFRKSRELENVILDLERKCQQAGR